MYWRKLIVISVIICVISPVLISGLALASSSSQTWYLDSDNHPSISSLPSIDNVWVMEREAYGSQSSSVILYNGDDVLWISDEPATSSVTFPESDNGNPWVIYLKTGNWYGSCTAGVGIGDSSGFTPFSNQSVFQQGYSSQGILKVLLTMGSQTVPVGKYLALKITNNSGTTRTIQTDGSSWLQSPTVDPGYPLPELITGILLSSGLVGLVVYIGVRRKAALKSQINRN